MHFMGLKLVLDLMGDFVNGHLTNIMNVCITLVVTVLNMLLLYTLFWG